MIMNSKHDLVEFQEVLGRQVETWHKKARGENDGNALRKRIDYGKHHHWHQLSCTSICRWELGTFVGIRDFLRICDCHDVAMVLFYVRGIR